MTHDELLEQIRFGNNLGNVQFTWEQTVALQPLINIREALRAAVELHKPIPSFTRFICAICMQRSDDDYEVYDSDYPCSTIQAIEKELI